MSGMLTATSIVENLAPGLSCYLKLVKDPYFVFSAKILLAANSND
jgi:hypothetical protein